MKKRNLYPAPEFIDIGELKDNDPPIFEPVNEYLISNAYINSNGYIFKNFQTVKETISFRHRNSVSFLSCVKNSLFKKKIEIDRPAISIMSGWGENFYHFTLESLPKLFVLKEHIDNATIVFPKDLKRFQKEWIEILELKNITYLNDDEVLKTPLAITSTFTSRDLNHHNLIIPEFRKWILSKTHNKKSNCPEKIFVGRKNPFHRKLLNLDATKNFAEKKGFVYLEMEDYDLSDQINFFANADEIICLHGAALTHICFTKPGTKIIDLIHKDFYQWCYLKLAKVLGLEYYQLRCSGDNQEHLLPGYRDIEVDIDSLSALI